VNYNPLSLARLVLLQLVMIEKRSGCPINLALEVLGDRWSLIVNRPPQHLGAHVFAIGRGLPGWVRFAGDETGPVPGGIRPAERPGGAGTPP